MEDNNEVYQSLLPADGESLKGLKYKDSKKAKGFVVAGYDARAANLNAPRTQKLSNLVGPTDYGNSSYDVQGESIPQVENLEDTRANAQPFIDKVGAGLGTFAAKAVTATAGAYATMFYGVPKAIVDGRFSAIFDNDVMKTLDSINQSTDETFKVYMSDSERNGNFFNQTIGSSHFWTKSLMGDGMSFVAGAVLASGGLGLIAKGFGVAGAVIGDALEVASGGSKILSKASNAFKLASGAFNGTEAISSIANASKFEKFIGGIGKINGIASRTAIGSMYEGGVEANDFIKQATQKYQKDFANKNGRLPDDNEMAKFNNDILPSANALFLGNVALVGASNFATLPGVFGKGVNETIKDARKLVGERLIEGGTEAFVKGSERKGLAKIGKAILIGFEPLYAEGIQEEGGQNFMKNMALDYIDKHYNPDATKNNYDLANSLGNAFNSAYMTKDGWKEILSGMIIGGFGAPNTKHMGAIETKEDGTKV